MGKQATIELTGRRYCLLLLVIVLAGILLRVFHFQLTVGMDDQKWILAAREFGHPHSGEVFPIHYCRILWRCVLAGWGSVFGLSLDTTAFLMVGLSCLSTVLVAQGARAAFGSVAALFAAAVYATHPLLVVYDAATLPDGFAVAILAAFLYLFLKYLQTERAAYLLSSAILVGLSYSAKEYFVLAALPFGAYLLFKQVSQMGTWKRVCLFSAGVLAGVSVDFLLHFWESGDPLWHVSVLSGYGGTPVAEQAGNSPHGGWERLARLVVKRLAYLKWLFLDVGLVSGFLVLWGAIFLGLKARADRACWILIGMVLVYSAFVLAMPTGIRPLSLVEMLPYYLMVLLPALAIGSGAALAAAYGSFQTGALRRSLLAAVTLGLASNVLVPNDLTSPLFRREHMESLVGIRQILEEAPQRSISELILPQGSFRVRVPDRYYEYGAKVRLANCGPSAAADIVEYLKGDPGRALYLPRHPISWLMIDVRRGERGPSGEVSQEYGSLASMLAAENCSVQRVRVPDTAVKAWLAKLGLIEQEQNLVGWLYRFEQTPGFGKGTVPFSLRENRDSPQAILRPPLNRTEVPGRHAGKTPYSSAWINEVDRWSHRVFSGWQFAVW